MKVLNVNSCLSLKTGGGTAERTFQMSRFLARSGVDTKVLALDIELNESIADALKPATLVSIACLLKRFYVPKFEWKRIKSLVAEADIIHLMGHWGVLNALVYIAARRANKPYVVCPAGALPLFGRSRIIKHIYNLLIGNSIIRNAAGWIAVTKSEFSQFEQYGINASRITVIPNGVDVDHFLPIDSSEFRKKFALSHLPIILFMGRLNAIKGPDLLLEAFIKAQNKIPKCQLVFAGPDGGMLQMLQQRAVEVGLEKSVHFLGYLDGKDKVMAYQAATLMIVPSRLEAMSIVALEAAVSGTPVMLTDQCGFGEVKSICSDFEVPASASGIADGLVKLLNNSDKLEKDAIALKEYVVQQYAWQSLTDTYVRLYSKVLN